jgi:hypothetical protein
MQTFEPGAEDRPEDMPQDDRYTDPHFLHSRQIAMIDEALRTLGAFGEVRLVVEEGRLRYIVTQKSYDALRWYPGKILKEE